MRATATPQFGQCGLALICYTLSHVAPALSRVQIATCGIPASSLASSSTATAWGGSGGGQTVAAPPHDEEFDAAVRSGMTGVFGLKLKPRSVELDAEGGGTLRTKIVEVTGVEPQCPSFGLLEVGDEIVAVADVDVRGNYFQLLEELRKYKFEPGGAPCRVLRRALSVGRQHESITKAEFERAKAAYDELMKAYYERQASMLTGVF